MNTYTTDNPKETDQLGAGIAERLPARVVVTLSGPLGSGKTALVQGMLRARGITQVSSPTFVYHQRYGTSDAPIDHFDLYRIHHDPSLIARTGVYEYIEAVPGWVLIEWPIDGLAASADVPVLAIEATGAPEFQFRLTTDDAPLDRSLGDLQ